MALLSLVQAVVAGGIALLALPARLWFGISIGRRELAGLILSAAGLALLALTADAAALVPTPSPPARPAARGPPVSPGFGGAHGRAL